MLEPTAQAPPETKWPWCIPVEVTPRSPSSPRTIHAKKRQKLVLNVGSLN